MVTLLVRSSVGGSLTGSTVTVNVRVTMLLEAAPSLTVTVTVVEPDKLATGVNESVPVGSGLLYETAGLGIRPVFADDAVMPMNWPSFGAPELIPVSGMLVGVSSLIVTLVIGSSVGGSFTGVMLSVKADAAVAPSASETITEMVQFPN